MTAGAIVNAVLTLLCWEPGPSEPQQGVRGGIAIPSTASLQSTLGPVAA